MRTALTADPTELLVQHLTTLRGYARRVLVDEEELFHHEEQDKHSRMREFIAIASS